jgi:hypothetical protein
VRTGVTKSEREEEREGEGGWGGRLLALPLSLSLSLRSTTAGVVTVGYRKAPGSEDIEMGVPLAPERERER